MTQHVSASVVVELEAARVQLEDQDTVAQGEVDTLVRELEPLKTSLQPRESDESLELVDHQGRPTGVTAPRWLCHSVGLRHRSVHVSLRWIGNGLRALVLQIRSPTKSNSPLHLDLSVGGHVKAGSALLESAHEEMREELGLVPEKLRDGRLSEMLRYLHYEQAPSGLFFNQEYCVVYEGELDTPSLDFLSLTGGEVAGLYLCPEDQLSLLRDQAPFPMASALRGYLERCVQ